MTAATSWGYGDAPTFPEHVRTADPQTADDRHDESLDNEAKALAAHTIETADLSRLVAEHEEWALLDLLLDAHRYGTDTDSAWRDLRAGLAQSLAARIRSDLARSRGWLA